MFDTSELRAHHWPQLSATIRQLFEWAKSESALVLPQAVLDELEAQWVREHMKELDDSLRKAGRVLRRAGAPPVEYATSPKEMHGYYRTAVQRIVEDYCRCRRHLHTRRYDDCRASLWATS